MLRKYNLFLAQLPGISANWDKNDRQCNFQAIANIFRKFQKISGNIKFPENSQPYVCYINLHSAAF